MASGRRKDRNNGGEGIFACPVCGEEIYKGMVACPRCGADDRSGWSSNAFFEPDFDAPGEFDYDQFVAEEFDVPRKKSGKETVWTIVAVLLILVFLYWMIR